MTEFDGSAQSWSLVAFSSVVALTLMLCVLTGPDRDDLDEFYTGYRSLSPLRNGLAIAGDYISAATVLTIGGVIALCGYDGVVLALSTVLSLLLLMVLLAEPCITPAGSPWPTRSADGCPAARCASPRVWSPSPRWCR